MKYRKLRIAWSMAWGFVALLLVALWMRSYLRLETVGWTFSRTLVEFTACRGELGNLLLDYGRDRPADSQGPEYSGWDGPEGGEVQYNDGTGRPLPSHFGFKSSWLSAPVLRGGDMSEFVMPYWFPTGLCACLVVLPWIRHVRWRFSLRTLLIAMTLVAVGLGLIVWLSSR